VTLRMVALESVWDTAIPMSFRRGPFLTLTQLVTWILLTSFTLQSRLTLFSLLNFLI
jgi:hypothetical protein